jgi:uncharacterized protein (TIGR02217 family)
MAILTFPTLAGLAFPVNKTPAFSTIEHFSVQGGSTTQQPQPFAKYKYELPYEFLRAANPQFELQTLMGFYQACGGKANPFHFLDPDDNAVVGQALGIGDGGTTSFAFLRTLASLVVDPIQDAIAAGMNIYVGGVLKATPADYTLLSSSQYATLYGVHFTVPPGVGVAVTADFSFNWLCRFDDDAVTFAKFSYLNGSGLWEAKSVKFTSVPQ